MPLTRIVDRHGFAWAELAWNGDVLVSLTVDGASISGGRIRDPLLGDAHAIVDRDGAVITCVSAIEWARPTEIPAIAAPGKLPPGAGGAILNVLAVLAERAGTTLRYAGPYPTSALWSTLQRSFRTTATEAEFIANLIERMATLSRAPIAIDFVPAPYERITIAGGHVELRDGVERATIDGVTYARGGSLTRLVEDHETGGVRAELWFGDTCYATIARFLATGTLIDGPHEIPPCTSDVIGKEFPAALVGALAELVTETVPAPLARTASAWLRERTIVWADLGARCARVDGNTIEVHAALWRHVAPHGLGRLALALAEALGPVIGATLVAELARATVPR